MLRDLDLQALYFFDSLAQKSYLFDKDITLLTLANNNAIRVFPLVAAL